MRRVIASTYMTLDGVITHPENWTFPFRTDEATAFAHDQLFASDALLMGRGTYEIFADAWPSRTDDMGFADRMNSLPKYVVSTTLATAEWNATVIGGDVAAEVAKLKQQPGKDILVYGYGALTETLMQHDLLDELRIWLHPVLVGGSDPDDLLRRDTAVATLDLVDVTTYDSGLVLLCYRPQGADRSKKD
ncbi:MAG: dihydrofolate reductase [Propionibacteriales bacterium]|nr:dihydrofolate reductase [Propionibacteriales bacterium]